MLEILKDNVLIAYQQLEQYQLDRYGRGVVSAIDRNRDMIFIKTAWQSVSVSLKDNSWEQGLDSDTVSNIRIHLALYRAFPQIGGIARPHARNATIFAQLGMDIPVLGSFHKSHFESMIPCAKDIEMLETMFRCQQFDPRNTPAALILSDSAYAWGENAMDAVTNAAVLEETAYLAYQTMQLDPGIRPIF